MFHRFFHIKTVRNRIIIVQLCVVIPAIILLGIMIYRLTCSLMIKSNAESFNKVLESSDLILKQDLDYYRDIARNILSDPVLQRELTKSNSSEPLEAGAELMGDLPLVNLDQAMDKYITGFSGIRSLCLYDHHGRLFYRDIHQDDYSAVAAAKYKNVSQNARFQKASKGDGYEEFAGYNIVTGDDSQFSCIKRLMNLETQEPIGMMIVNFEKTALKKVFPSDSRDRGIYAIVEQEEDTYHFVIINSDKDTDRETMLDVLEGQNEEYHLAEFMDEDICWKLVYMIETGNILGEAGRIKQIISAGLIITIGILCWAVVLLCNRITRPLYQLKDDILRVGNGERYLPGSFPDDEIGAIGKEFSKMVNEKLALSEKVIQAELKNKEAELELLQANINPHFLYNTLDSLYWMAILHDAEDIAALTKALSDIFKAALSKGEKYITVREELNFLKSYLYIQNIRFKGKIEVDIRMEEGIMEQKIMKLLLQPFVENAVYHGLEPKAGKGKIMIKGYKYGKILCFEVEDDGVGTDVQKALSRGYALKNSMERIRLVYGEEAGIDLESAPGNGMRVKIYFPEEGAPC